jgi:heme/copper-type cytochrome/quinol oxidase subunit 2
MYARKTFKGEYETKTTKVNDNHYQLEVIAKTFVKSLFIHMPDNYKYLYSDNYLDLEAGETVTVDITSNEVIDINSLILEDYKG